ncbi:MAG: hypothetical protein U0586_11090 [Candidatus Brocadiaceae bacterium]
MTLTMRFDGNTLYVVIVYCALSLQRATLSLRAKRSNLSLINKQRLLIRVLMEL